MQILTKFISKAETVWIPSDQWLYDNLTNWFVDRISTSLLLLNFIINAFKANFKSCCYNSNYKKRSKNIMFFIAFTLKLFALWARNMCEIFSLAPFKRNLSPEKTNTNWVFTFYFLNDKIDNNTNFVKLPSAIQWLFLVKL